MVASVVVWVAGISKSRSFSKNRSKISDIATAVIHIIAQELKTLRVSVRRVCGGSMIEPAPYPYLPELLLRGGCVGLCLLVAARVVRRAPLLGPANLGAIFAVGHSGLYDCQYARHRRHW